MRYLYRPSPVEELSVRGRYEFTGRDGSVWATEAWERYRNDNSPVEIWRSEWKGNWNEQAFLVQSHTVVSPEGIERLKAKISLPGQPSQLVTVTTMADEVLVNDESEISEVALPPGYGLFAPQPSLARFAFPFDLAIEGRELAMLFHLRARLRIGRLQMRPTKFGYRSLGLREFSLRGERLRAKGWQMEVPGLPVYEGWFDRNGSCLLWVARDERHPWEARLTEWMVFR